MPAKVTAAEAAGVILHRLRGVRAEAAAAVRAAAQVAVRAEAAQARVSVRAAERVIARDRAGAAIGTVIHPVKVTVAVPVTNTRRVRAAEVIPRYRNPAKAQEILQASLSIRLQHGREKKRPANPILQNTRNRKIRRCNGMILIAGPGRR
jgi:hypothetical protein